MSAGISGIALGLIGAGVIGGASTLIAGNQASKATEGATNAAVNEQQAALAQQKELATPYLNLGSSAIPQYQALLGLGPNGAAGEQAALAATPGYQFAKTQGLQATTNQASAMGLGLSGNTLEGLDKFSTGLADSTYQQALGNSEQAVGLGQAAAAGQAANVGNAASNISGALINQGNTTAGIDTNTVAGLTKTIGNTTNQIITANTLAGLNNPGYVSTDPGSSVPAGVYTG